MAKNTERPRAGDPPRVNEPLEILKELLEAERERLIVARRIEKERSMIFPETTVIVRDIMKLTEAIELKEKKLLKKR